MAGSIVPGSTRTQTSKKGGRADLQSLLLHTPHHPKGRVQIDPDTGMVKNPKNNILFKKNIPVKVEGQVIGLQEVPVNGGHAKKDGSVWRIALGGPVRYHLMVVADDYRFTYQGRNDRTAPTLTPEEFEEYQFFRTFVIDEKIKVPVTRDDQQVLNEIDEMFYTWLEGKDKETINLQPLVPVHPNAPTAIPVM